MFLDWLSGPGPTPQGMMAGPSGPLVDAVRGMPVLNQAALATAPIPVVGDLVGLAADARMYATQPESRTLVNFGLTGLGMLPFIPALSTVSRLPMDEASRVARAEEMGYTANLFHQTAPENVDSLMRDGFDFSRVGARSGDEMMPDGAFLKPDSADIGVGGPAQLNMRANLGRSLELPNRESFRWWLRDKAPDWWGASTEVGRYDREMARRFDELEKVWFSDLPPRGQPGHKEAFEKSIAESDAFLAEWKSGINERAAKARKIVTETLKREGFDSLRIFDDAGSFGRSTETVVVLDPSRLRSADAAFDPSKRASKSLMASHPAATAIGGGLAGGLWLRSRDREE